MMLFVHVYVRTYVRTYYNATYVRVHMYVRTRVRTMVVRVPLVLSAWKRVLHTSTVYVYLVHVYHLVLVHVHPGIMVYVYVPQVRTYCTRVVHVYVHVRVLYHMVRTNGTYFPILPPLREPSALAINTTIGNTAIPHWYCTWYRHGIAKARY
jgi:hypothetical protein